MKIFDTLANKFTHFQNFIDIISKRKVIYFGENHGKSQIIQLQTQILQGLIDKNLKINLYMEHFAFNQQNYIDQYMALNLDIYELYSKYQQSSEGHNIIKYNQLLEKARYHNVNLKAGFIPREFARELLKDQQSAIEKAQILDYIPNYDYSNQDLQRFINLESSDDHYNFFVFLITQKFDSDDKFRQIFKAQLLKDNAMAYKIKSHIDVSKQDEIFLVILGNGHCEYGFGVPERVNYQDSCIISVRNKDDYDDVDEQEKQDEPASDEKFEERYNKLPADFVFFYENDVKQEVMETYDQVATKIQSQGVNIQDKSQQMIKRGYTVDEIQIIKEHISFFQGVGCPQKLANIQSGEIVIDLGCGFGLDSMIAAYKVGQNGKIYSVDISQGEINIAKQICKQFENIQFQISDIDEYKQQELADVIISNGAFCLLPDKYKSFKKVHSLLKPGGRLSIACCLLNEQLDDSVEWPLCINQFYPLNKIEQTLKEIGFTNIIIDQSDSLMVELNETDQKIIDQENQDRNLEQQINLKQCIPNINQQNNIDQQISPEQKLQQQNDDQIKLIQDDNIKVYHNNDIKYQHLQNFDMNKVCLRAVIFAQKI